MENTALIREAVLRLTYEVGAADFDVKNETEFGHLFFAACWEEAKNAGIPLNSLRSEIRLMNGGRIDFGVRPPDNGNGFELFLELKVWVRPLHVSHMSKANVATRKRKECVEDALRLSKVIGNRKDCHSGLLVLERNSTHLRRLLGSDLNALNVQVEEQWLDLARQSQGKHQEHIGLIWLYPNSHFNADAPNSGAPVK